MRQLILALITIPLLSATAFAADLQTTTRQVTKAQGKVYRFVLDEGEKLTDKQALVAFANRTVPTGKWAQVTVRIDVTLHDGRVPDGALTTEKETNI